MTGNSIARVAFPLESRFVQINGCELAFVDEGHGSPLLFVHGNPTWSFAWRRFIGEFSHTHRTVAVDHMGCGRSSKPQAYDYSLDGRIRDLCELIELLDLSRITLIGHDWGGAIGAGCASRMRDRFSRLVFCNTAAFRSTRIPWRIALCRIPLLGTLAIRGLNAFSRAALSMAVEKSERMTKEVRQAYLAPYDSWASRVAVDAFVKDIPMRPSHPSWATLIEVEEGLSAVRDCPVLLMWGARDWCFTTRFLSEFQQRLPQAETLLIPDAGHYVFEDAHEQMIPRLRQFLEDHPLD